MPFNIVQRPQIVVMMMAGLSMMATTVIASDTTAIDCPNTFHACTEGCWNPGGTVLGNGIKVCEPAGLGFYSPADSNERFVCPAGTFSDGSTSGRCTSCPPGSISSIGQSECLLCPSGFFQDRPGQVTCLSCTPGYAGKGANSFRFDFATQSILCVLDGVSPSMVPSQAPSMNPTKAPSTEPSSMPSLMPSLMPSVVPSLAPSILPSDNPSTAPTNLPSATPTTIPSTFPSLVPSTMPSTMPSTVPSIVPTYRPSNTPSMMPSLVPSLVPSVLHSDGPSVVPSGVPTNVESSLPSSVPSGMDTLSFLPLDDACAEGSYAVYGQCQQCPSPGTWFFRSLAGLLSMAIMSYLFLFKPLPLVVMGIDTVQIASWMGFVGIPWTHLLQYVFNAFSVMGMELSFVVPTQCLAQIDVTPQISQSIILFVPFVVCGVLGLLAITKTINFTRAVHIGATMLLVGYGTLVLASLEAISCSHIETNLMEVDWMCFQKGSSYDIGAAIVGTCCLVLFGAGVPVLLMGLLSFGEWTSPYRVGTWPFWLLGRKVILAFALVFFREDARLTMAVFLVVLVGSWIGETKLRVFAQDKDSSTMRRTNRLVVLSRILQGAAILVCCVGFGLGSFSPTSDIRTGFALLALAACAAAFISWLVSITSGFFAGIATAESGGRSSDSDSASGTSVSGPTSSAASSSSSSSGSSSGGNSTSSTVETDESPGLTLTATPVDGRFQAFPMAEVVRVVDSGAEPQDTKKKMEEGQNAKKEHSESSTDLLDIV